MSIQDRLQEDLKVAMRAGERQRADIIRLARAALQSAQQEVAKQRYDNAVKELDARLGGDAEGRERALAALEIDPRTPLDEGAQEAVLAKEIKRRHDAAEMYRKGGREDRAAQEEEEARILGTYLPQQLSADELRPQVAALIEELGLKGPASMGKLMPTLMERFKGQTEGRVLSQLARELLAQG